MIGGKEGKAHYFVGRINKTYIYLDPHTVNKAVSNKNIINEQG